HFHAGIELLIALRSFDRTMEADQTIDGRLPLRECRIDADEPRQRFAHEPECAGGLHQAAEWNGAREKTRRGDDEREDHRELSVARREPRQLLGLPHDQPPIREDALKSIAEA